MIFLGVTTVRYLYVICSYIHICSIHTYYCALLSRKPITMSYICVYALNDAMSPQLWVLQTMLAHGARPAPAGCKAGGR